MSRQDHAEAQRSQSKTLRLREYFWTGLTGFSGLGKSVQEKPKGNIPSILLILSEVKLLFSSLRLINVLQFSALQAPLRVRSSAAHDARHSCYPLVTWAV